MAFFYALYALLCIIFLYAVYKLLWYTVKMLVLRVKLGRGKVRFHRSFLMAVFGKKGKADFTVSTRKEDYVVSVISYVSTHGRWHIERAGDCFYAESRRHSNVFYSVYNHSGEPEHSKLYRRETRIQRNRLHLSEEHGKYEKRVLLFYPKPKLLTYADTSFDYLGSGSLVNGYEVWFEKDLLAHIQKGE